MPHLIWIAVYYPSFSSATRQYLPKLSGFAQILLRGVLKHADLDLYLLFQIETIALPLLFGVISIIRLPAGVFGSLISLFLV